MHKPKKKKQRAVYFKIAHNTRLPRFIADLVSTLLQIPNPPPLQRLTIAFSVWLTFTNSSTRYDKFNPFHAMRLYWRTGNTVPFTSNLDNRLI